MDVSASSSVPSGHPIIIHANVASRENQHLCENAPWLAIGWMYGDPWMIAICYHGFSGIVRFVPQAFFVIVWDEPAGTDDVFILLCCGEEIVFNY